MDKATPDSVPATYGSVMALYKEVVHTMLHDEEGVFQAEAEFRAELERLAAQAAPTEPDLDTLRADFHKWCATNGYKTGFVEGGECPMGRPVYSDFATHAAWWAFQKAAKLYAVAQSAPLQQAECTCAAKDMPFGRCCRAAAQVEPVRMLTQPELNDVALSEKVGWGPGEYVEAVQRKFAEVNGLRIPADGKIGDAA